MRLDQLASASAAITLAQEERFQGLARVRSWTAPTWASDRGDRLVHRVGHVDRRQVPGLVRTAQPAAPHPGGPSLPHALGVRDLDAPRRWRRSSAAAAAGRSRSRRPGLVDHVQRHASPSRCAIPSPALRDRFCDRPVNPHLARAGWPLPPRSRSDLYGHPNRYIYLSISCLSPPWVVLVVVHTSPSPAARPFTGQPAPSWDKYLIFPLLSSQL